MIRFNNTNYGSLYGFGSYGSTNSIYSNLSQLSSVRSGAYSKALKAYYGKTNTSSVSQKNVLNNRTFLNNLYASKYDDVQKQSSELASSAQKLTATGKGSLFANKDEYDSDKRRVGGVSGIPRVFPRKKEKQKQNEDLKISTGLV